MFLKEIFTIFSNDSILKIKMLKNELFSPKFGFYKLKGFNWAIVKFSMTINEYFIRKKGLRKYLFKNFHIFSGLVGFIKAIKVILR